MKGLMFLIFFSVFGFSSVIEKTPSCPLGVYNSTSGVCEVGVSCVSGVLDADGECASSPLSGELDVYSIVENIDNACNVPVYLVVDKVPGRTSYVERDVVNSVVDKNLSVEVGASVSETYPASWSCPAGYVLGGVSDSPQRCEYEINSSLCPSGQTWNSALKICEGFSNGILVEGNAQVIDYTKKEAGTSYTDKTSTTETVPLDAVQIITGSRAGSYAQWNKTSTANKRAYVMWVAGKNGPECWNGWKPWENFSKYNKDTDKYRDNYYHKVDNSRCEYYLGTYNIYGIKYICPPSAQDWDWKVDESAGNCKRVVVVCPVGYTETVGAEIANGGCKKNVTICPVGYTETVGAEIAKGECKKNITYPYYKYSCPAGYDAPKNPGQTTVPVRTDSNGTTINNELSNPYNSSTLPTNNCYIKSNITCKSNGTLTNSMCQLSSNLKCPNGGTLQGINCVTSTTLCETGFTLKNGSCVKETFTCPSGYEEASEKTCKKTTYSCPEGTTLEGTQCKKVIPEQCPVGYNEKNGKCQKESFNPDCKKTAQCIRDEIKCETGSYPSQDGKLCISKKTETCTIGYRYNAKTEKCEANPYCSTGFLDTKDGCSREYEYSLYSCPAGFEEPLDKGFDCGGSSPDNGYACNSQTPPANNCRKPITTNKTIEIIKKRELETHVAYGSVVPQEYGVHKDIPSGENSQFSVSKITGEDNNLCFFRKNGEKDCITVAGCSFNGTIENNTYPNDIQELNLDNQYTIALEYDNPKPLIQEDGLICPNGMQYDKKTKYCVSPVQNFNTWVANNNGTGKWQVLSQTEVYQTVNGSNNTFFLSPVKYPKDVLIQGDIQVTDNGADDDNIGIVFDYKDANNFKTVIWDNGSVNGGSYAKGLLYAEFKNGVRTDYVRHTIRWKTNVKYNIKVLYTLDLVQVFINNALYIDYKNTETNIQDLGQAGFINQSQDKVRYSNFKIESKPVCSDDYKWDSSLRLCYKQPTKNSPQTITSSCKMNGHVGWHSRTEGIVSIIPDNPKNINRIKFWDSYKDKDLGFIEFVKDVKPEDKADGFIPQNQFLYEMLAADFTASEVVENNTFFVSSTVLSNAECSAIASKKGLPKASITSNSIKELLKKLSGDRYVKTEVEPACPGGVFSKEVNSCISVSTDKASCPNGGFDTVNTDYQWDNFQGDNITAYTPIYIPVAGVYTISVKTKGRASLYINNSIAGVATAKQGLFVSKFYFEQGVQEIKIFGEKNITCATGSSNCTPFTGERGFQVVVSDELGTTISNSADWCKNLENQSCPDNGYVKIGNMCIPKTVPHCQVGVFDEVKSVCVIEPKCILVKNGENRFNDQTNSEKKETRNSEVLAFKCSPLKCDNNSCQTADCPIDNPPYKGNIIHAGMTALKATECVADSCDANKDYYPFCGREQGCDVSNPMVYETETGVCMEMYCPNGSIFDISNKKCKKMECPENSVKQPDGSCKRK